MLYLFQLYVKLRPGPLDNEPEQRVHLFEEIVEHGRQPDFSLVLKFLPKSLDIGSLSNEQEVEILPL
jgi:hypothetical protein